MRFLYGSVFELKMRHQLFKDESLFAFDLHVHSEFSYDSYLKIPRILETAMKRKLDGIAITDHGTIKGGLEGQRLAQNGNLIVICGAEIYSDCGHIIGLFLTDEIRKFDALEVVDLIKSQGGISILAHPFQKASSIDKELIKRVDGIESWNSRTSLSRNSQSALIARKLKIAEVAGSDAHFSFEIARGITLTKVFDLRKAILHHETQVDGTCSNRFVHFLTFATQMVKTKTLKPVRENRI
jgi:predicted metal-dependent phosphoesterase TrpH